MPLQVLRTYLCFVNKIIRMKNTTHQEGTESGFSTPPLSSFAKQKPSVESPATPVHDHDHHHDHDHDGGHNHGAGEAAAWLSHWPLLLALAFLLTMLTLEYGFGFVPAFPLNLGLYGTAYLLAGYQVLDLAFRKAKRLDFFNEFFLMSIATLGAFAIGSFSEGVAVMVFYSVGEWFQDTAVHKARRSIKALLDIRPEEVTVIRNNLALVLHPNEVQIGEVIQLKHGERVALDGTLVSEQATFDTSALTGESKPDTKRSGEKVYAGMINLNSVAQIKVASLFRDSKLSKILDLVQHATARKSQTQLFISRFARVYTPVVFFLAAALVVFPYFLMDDYVFATWFYRSLVFLVISCPCALVVSIPLGYFGGIGLASRQGILFKGANFLDVMTKVNTLVMDKTGTLTEGVFKVQQVYAAGMGEQELMKLTAAVESHSTHPIARAVLAYAGQEILEGLAVRQVKEISGLGLQGLVNGQEVLVGNVRLLQQYHIDYPAGLENLAYTTVVIAVDQQYAGYLTIADEIKADAAETIRQLHALRIQTVMLSGDKQAVVKEVAARLHIDQAYGELLPEEKVEKVQALRDAGNRIAFVGDGVNDAPVVALADAGIAMGGLGSDATIETADIVIQNDQPSRIVSAIRIGKITRSVVWQNIALAMGVKVIVLVLGAGGIATLWEAVIADVGVALLAILNAVRIQHMKV